MLAFSTVDNILLLSHIMKIKWNCMVKKPCNSKTAEVYVHFLQRNAQLLMGAAITCGVFPFLLPSVPKKTDFN